MRLGSETNSVVNHFMSRGVTGLRGDASGLRGDASGLTGDASGLRGDLDLCGLTDAERLQGVDARDLA